MLTPGGLGNEMSQDYYGNDTTGGVGSSTPYGPSPAGGSVELPCPYCKHINFTGMDYCDGCGESLKDEDLYN